MFIRSPAEAEIYGLKIAQLLLPLSGHRLKMFAEIKNRYNQAPLVNENDTATLGEIGGAGFLFLLGWLGFRLMRPNVNWLTRADRELLDYTALLTTATTLLATVGGFGSLLAIFAFPEIRAYNRISIYLAFFCLLVVALLIDRVIGSRIKSRNAYLFYCVGMAILLVFGLLDETARSFAHDYRSLRLRFASDKQFVQSIERTLTPGSMIFQLPYGSFPESSPTFRMTAYDPLLGYLHSRTLRWSFGGMIGGKADVWQKHVAEEPPTEMLEALALVGFAGIYLDRYGYIDQAEGTERQLQGLLTQAPLTSENGRLAFYDLRPFAARLRTRLSGQQWRLAEAQVRNPPSISFGDGFYNEESNGLRKWRWTSSSEVDLHLANSSGHDEHVLLQLTLATGHPQSSSVRLTGPGLDCQVKVDFNGLAISKPIVLPKGDAVLHLSTDAPKVIAPADPRTMFLRIEDVGLLSQPAND